MYIYNSIGHCGSSTRTEKMNRRNSHFLPFMQGPVDPGEACPGPSGNITQYQISFQTGSVVVTEIMNSTECIAGICDYTYRPSSNGSVCSSYDSVSVAAENVVGVGAARTCTTQTISELLKIYSLRTIAELLFFLCRYCQFCLDQCLLCVAW